MEDLEDVGDDIDEGFCDDGGDFELDLGLSSFEALTPSENGPENEILKSAGAPIGKAFSPSLDRLQDEPNLDWALFTVEDNSLRLPNIVGVDEITKAANPNRTGAERMVFVETATRERVYGRLSNSWSYLMLASGKCLVRTNALKIFNDQGWLLFPTDYRKY
jgi:hypothetical protein